MNQRILFNAGRVTFVLSLVSSFAACTSSTSTGTQNPPVGSTVDTVVTTSPSSTDPTSSAGVPSLSYRGSAGKHTAINFSMSITPSSLNSNGASITACGIKPGSDNASLFPGSLTIDPRTCVISGVPTQVLANTQFTIVATNAIGISSDAELSLSVSPCDSSQAFGGGLGTAASPYLLCSPQHLQNMNSNMSGNYQVVADIDMTGFAFTTLGSGWVVNPFTGVLDGNGHKISNLNIDTPSSNNAGIFATISSSTVKDLHLKNFNISGNAYVGALAGYGYASTLSHVTSSGLIIGQGNNVGGLIGMLYYGGIIDSSSSAQVIGDQRVGGLAGFTTHLAIVHSHATGNITGGTPNGADQGVGGLVGAAWVGTQVMTSYATGNVFGYTGYTGGVGGLIGILEYGSSIADSYATGNVFGLGASYGISALAGADVSSGTTESITRSYATGSVAGTLTGTATQGGLLGYYVNTGSGSITILDSYWNTKTTNQLTSVGGGIGSNTDSMQSQATYANWDFAKVWNAPVVGSSYPTLR